MPFTAHRPNRQSVRVALPWLAAAVPMVLGVVILYWQAQSALELTAQTTAEQAIGQFELMLDNLSESAQILLPLAGKPCSEVEFTLRDQVTRRPFVRSTTLSVNNQIYCGSLLGSYQEAVNPDLFVDGHLWLMTGNVVTPNQAVMVYRLADGQRAAMATVDGYHLANALRLIGRDTELVLQVGNHWLAATGEVHQGTPPEAPVTPIQARSNRYPFSIHTGYASGETWQLLRTQYQGLFGLLVFLGLLAGAICRWALRRAHSPYQELLRAIDASEFVPYYQPLVRGNDGLCNGAEVLMRWAHPRQGLVRPDLFIPYAEDCGLIVPMTRLLMQKAALEIAAHIQHFADGFHIGINITESLCQDPSFYDECVMFLSAFAPGKVTLVLELTERELVRPTAQTQALFERLHALGVLIAIDDFGTGHSSLAYLREFNVDYLKIDQSFVAMIGVDALSGHILDSIIELSAKLDLGIVAEGVETEVQRAYLAEHKVDLLQGYLFGKPMPIETFVSTLSQS